MDKDKFLNLLENHQWKNVFLKELCCVVVPHYIPNYFWTVPASITGKHHPPDSLGEGGLLRHTHKVILMGLKMGEADTTQNADEIIASCAFHDICKYGVGKDVSNNRQDFYQHPRLAKEWLWDIFDSSVYPCNDMEEDAEPIITNYQNASYTFMVSPKDYRLLLATWIRICDAVERHYGKWGRENNLPLPSTRLDFIVSHADLISSMKCFTYEETTNE